MGRFHLNSDSFVLLAASVIIFQHVVGVFDKNDNLITLMGTVQDISERKQAEEELRESEARYRSVVDNIGIGIALIGQNMEVLSVNNVIR